MTPEIEEEIELLDALIGDIDDALDILHGKNPEMLDVADLAADGYETPMQIRASLGI